MHEDMPKDPQRIYDSAKLMDEQTALYDARNMGLDVAVLRFSTTYGSGKTARHGAMSVTSQIVEQPFNGLPFHLAESGDAKDDFIHNKDAALGIFLATVAPKVPNRVYNIGSGAGNTRHDFAAVIRKKIPGADIKIGPGLKFIAMPYNPHGVYDVSRARDELGFKAEYDIERAVEDYIASLERMMEAMLANGGEEPTLFLWACDRHPYPHPFRVPTTRPIERGDLIICEIHPKTGGYFTHVERTYCVGGKPSSEQRRIYDGCIEAYEAGMSRFKAGTPISTAMNHVADVVRERGLGMCELGIHGHGLASLEYPRYRHHALKADQEALKVVGDEFRKDMVFASNIDLVDPAWRNGETGCVFAETVHIGDDGPRRLHSFPMNFQLIKA